MQGILKMGNASNSYQKKNGLQYSYQKKKQLQLLRNRRNWHTCKSSMIQGQTEEFKEEARQQFHDAKTNNDDHLSWEGKIN